MKEMGLISRAFQLFHAEAPKHAKAWMEMVQSLSTASALDERTRSIAYLSVLAALRLESGLPFHVSHAKRLGVTREEVISAILVGLPAAGHVVTQALPIALETYDRA